MRNASVGVALWCVVMRFAQATDRDGARAATALRVEAPNGGRGRNNGRRAPGARPGHHKLVFLIKLTSSNSYLSVYEIM